MAPIAVVTGASRGIGAATALAVATAGYDVCVNYLRNEARANEVVGRIEAMGQRAVAVQADTAEEADIIRMFETADAELGPLNALVNNAGIVGTGCLVEDVVAKELERVLLTNLAGPFLCSREAVRRMAHKNGGSGGAIVNLSSAAAKLGSPFEFVHYAASKGGIESFTLGLAKEVAAEGIRVNAVRPGMIDTEIHASAGMPDRCAVIGPTVPMKRVGSPEEVAEAIVWLLSEQASYVTGSTIDVSGGR